MRHVSNEYRETMEDRTNFYPEATITFADGREESVGMGKLNLSGNGYVESAYSSSFPLGILVSKQVNISLINDEDQWSDYDFFGAKIFLQTKYKLDSGLIETLNIGTFTVITPESYGTTVEFTAMDDGYKADKEYSTNLSYPLSAGEALRDSCRTCGFTLLTTTFSNDNFVIEQSPSDLTHRQFIGMIAMIAGGNARFDEYNRLMIMPYDFSYFEKYGLDGGSFDKLALSEYVTGDTADGGSFAPWNTGDTCDGGEFGDRADIHVLYEFKSGMRLGVDDVVITGVQITDEDKEVHLYGTEGYVLDLSNQLADGKEDQVVQLIGQKIVGLRFRPFTADHISYPLAEFGDLAYLVDRKQNVYQTVITDVDFNYFGFTTLKCSADSPIRNSSTYYGNETKAIVAARKNTEKQISDYDRAVQQLTTLITQSFGVFKTEEVLEDGSTIFYLHNKPTLAESNTIWKMTADAFAVSTDGGKTWNAGMDSFGNAVVNVLSAIGINFDWAHGGTLMLGGVSNGNGICVVRDKDGNALVTLDNLGITLAPNVRIAWKNISGTEDIATVSDLPTDAEIVNLIFDNRGTIITKEYIGTLKVVAGSVAAEDITGTNIEGKTLTGTTGYFDKLVMNAGTNIYYIGTSGNEYPLFFMDSNFVSAKNRILFRHNLGVDMNSRLQIGGIEFAESIADQKCVFLQMSDDNFIIQASDNDVNIVTESENIYFNNSDGSGYANAYGIFYNQSDIRYKKTYNQYISKEISRNIITNLTPIAYEYTDGTKGLHRGFSAQEIHKIMDDNGVPECVYQYNADNDKYYANQLELIPDIVNCVKDLYEKINVLEKENEMMKKEIDKIKK